MRPALRHQLARLDRTLLALLDERQRLVLQAGPGEAAAEPFVEDLLRRHGGPFPVEELRRVLEAVAAAARRAEEVRG